MMTSTTQSVPSVLRPSNGHRDRPPQAQPSRRSAPTDPEEAASVKLAAADAREIRIAIGELSDIATARRQGRALAIELGFEGGDVILIVAVISEMARNIVDYARCGEVLIRPLQQAARSGILVVAQDTGPGIPDLIRAMQYGCATRKGLGMGLPGVRWLVDEFEISSKAGQGTTVTTKKWVKKFE